MQRVDLDSSKSKQLKIVFFDNDPVLSSEEANYINELSEDDFKLFLRELCEYQLNLGHREPINDRNQHPFKESIKKKYTEIFNKLESEFQSKCGKEREYGIDRFIDESTSYLEKYKKLFDQTVSPYLIPGFVTNDYIKKWLIYKIQKINDADSKLTTELHGYIKNDKRLKKLLYTDPDVSKAISDLVEGRQFKSIYNQYNQKKQISSEAEEKKDADDIQNKPDLVLRGNNRKKLEALFLEDDKFNAMARSLLFKTIPGEVNEFYKIEMFQSDEFVSAIASLLKKNVDLNQLTGMLIVHIFYGEDNELSDLPALKSAMTLFKKEYLNNQLNKNILMINKIANETVISYKKQYKIDVLYKGGDGKMSLYDLKLFQPDALRYLIFNIPKSSFDSGEIATKRYENAYYIISVMMIMLDTTSQMSDFMKKVFDSNIFWQRIGNAHIFIDGFKDYLKAAGIKLESASESDDTRYVSDNYKEFVNKLIKANDRILSKQSQHPYLQSNKKADKSQFQMQQQQQQVQVKNMFKEKELIEFESMPDCVADKTSKQWKLWFGSVDVEVSTIAFEQLKDYKHLNSLGINLDNLPMGFYKGTCKGVSFIDYDQKQVDILRKTPLTLRLFEKPEFDFSIADQYKDPLAHLGGEFEKNVELKDMTLSAILKAENVTELKTILNKMLQADDRELANQIKLELLLGVDPHYNRVKSTVLLCYTHGVLGVKLLQDQLQKLEKKGCNLEVFRALFLKSAADWGNEFMNSRFVDAVNGIARFNKSELIWWNELVKQHLEGTHYGNLPELYNAFTYFCENYKSITKSDNLPDQCPLTSVGHMQVGLDRLLKILLHTPKVDLSNVKLGIDDYHEISRKFKPIVKQEEKKQEEPLVELPKRPLELKRLSETDDVLNKQFDTSKVDDVIVTMKDLRAGKPDNLDEKHQEKLSLAFQFVNQIGRYGDAKLGVAPVYNMNNAELQKEIGRIGEQVKKLISISTSDQKEIQKNQLIYLALAREALYRADEQHRFANSTQMIAVINEIIGHSGNSFAQIETGQGKSLITALMASMLLLESKAVEICTSDAHLAKEGLREFSSFYQFMHIPVSNHVISATSDENDYKKNGINYSDVASLAIYHDRMKLAHGKGFFAGKISGIVDEADYVVGLQTTMRLTTDSLKESGELKGVKTLADDALSWGVYPILNEFIDHPDFINPPIISEDKRADLIKKAQAFLLANVAGSHQQAVIEFLQDTASSDRAFDKWLHAAVRAKSAFQREASGGIIVEAVKVGEDQYQSKAFHVINNVKQEQAQLKDGGQQFLHARLHKKYQLEIDSGLRPPFIFEPETATLTSTISKSLVKFYQGTGGRLKGTTGTLGDAEDRADLVETFGVSLTGYPTHQLKQRIDRTQILSDQAKIDAEVMREIKHRIRKSDTPQPMLIVCKDSAEAKRLYEFVFKEMRKSSSLIGKSKLRLSTVPYKKLNGKDESPDENKVIADAAQSGFITITDESLSRGKDFKPKHDEGLFVLQTYLGTEKGAEQVKGRAGRQGNVGESLQLVDSRDLIPGSSDVLSVLSKTRSMHARSSRKMRKFDEFYADMDAYFTDKFLDAYSSATDDKKPGILGKFIAFRETMETSWTEIYNKRQSDRNTDAETVAALRGCKEEFISTIYDKWALGQLDRGQYNVDMNARFPGVISEVQSAPKVQDQGILVDDSDIASAAIKPKARSGDAQRETKARQQWHDKLQSFTTDLRSDNYAALDRYLAKLREIHLNTKTELKQSGGDKLRSINPSLDYLNDKMDYFAFAIDSARGALLLAEESNINDESKLELRYLITQKLKLLQQKLTALDPSHDNVLKDARLLHKYFHRDLARFLEEHNLGADLNNRVKILESMHKKGLLLFSLDREREHFSLAEKKYHGLYNQEEITEKTSKKTRIRPIQIVYEKPLESLLKADENLTLDFSQMLSHLSKADGVIAKIQVELLKAFSTASDRSNDLKPLVSLMINGIETLKLILSDDDVYPLSKLDDIKKLLSVDNQDDQEQVKNIDDAYRNMIDLLERLPLSQQNQYLGSLFRVYDLSIKSYKYPLATISSQDEYKAAVVQSLPDEKSSVKPPSKLASIFNSLMPKFLKKGKADSEPQAVTQKSGSSTSLMTKGLLSRSSSVKKNKLTIATLDDSIHKFLANEPLKQVVNQISPNYVYTVDAKSNLAKDAVYVDKVPKDTTEYEIHTLQLPENKDADAYLSLAYIQIKQFKQFIEEMKKLKGEDKDFTIYVRENTCSEMVNAYRLIAAANGLSLVNETDMNDPLNQDELSNASKQYGNLNKEEEFKERCLWQQQVLDDLAHIKDLKADDKTDKVTLDTIDKRLGQRLQQFNTFFGPSPDDKYGRFKATKESIEEAKQNIERYKSTPSPS